MLTWRSNLLALLLGLSVIAMTIPLLTSCQTSSAERQEIRQGARVEARTQGRVEARRD